MSKAFTPQETLECLPSLAFGTGGNICGYPDKADRTKAVALLTSAIEHAKARGEYLWIDSALHYGAGFSLSCIGEALGETPYDKVILSFKVGRVLVPKGTPGAEPSAFLLDETHDRQFDYSTEGVRRAFDQSFEQLNAWRPADWPRVLPGQLPTIVFVHDPERGVHGERFEAVVQQVRNEALPALEDLRKQGKLQLTGIGTNEVEAALRFVDAPGVDLLMTAGRMTLLAHGAPAAPQTIQTDTALTPELIEKAKQHGKTLISAAPGNSGIMYGKSNDKTNYWYNYAHAPAEVIRHADAIKGVFAGHGIPVEAGVTQFPLLLGARAVVCGPSSMEEFRRLQEAQERPVSAELWTGLASAGLISPTALPAVSRPRVSIRGHTAS